VIKAQEARRLADTFNARAGMAWLYERIKDAAQAGKTSYQIGTGVNLSDGEVAALQADGYRVERLTMKDVDYPVGSQVRHVGWLIKW
jgi:hypothetical protein